MDLQGYKDIYVEPSMHLFGKCPVCKELVRMKVEDDELLVAIDRCRHCGALLDTEEILPSVVNHFLITQAISTANNFWVADYALIAFVVQMVSSLFTPFPFGLGLFVSLTGISFLFGVIYWFFKHGRWDSDDEEYVDAKKKMRWSLLLWTGANVLNVILILTIKVPAW